MTRDGTPPALTFTEAMRGYHHGQADVTLCAWHEGQRVGHIDYSVFAGDPKIQMITVTPLVRRHGVASALLRELQGRFTGREIEWGMLVGDGPRLRMATPMIAVSDPEVEARFERLARVREKESRYRKLADAFAERVRSESERQAFLSETSDWNDLHDEICRLEAELAHARPVRMLIATEARQDEQTPDGSLAAP